MVTGDPGPGSLFNSQPALLKRSTAKVIFQEWILQGKWLSVGQYFHSQDQVEWSSLIYKQDEPL